MEKQDYFSDHKGK